MMSALIYDIRLLTLYAVYQSARLDTAANGLAAVSGPPPDPATTMMTNLQATVELSLYDGTPTAFTELFSLCGYGTAIARNHNQRPTVQWIKETTLNFKGFEISMDDIQTMINTLIDDTEQSLCRELLFNPSDKATLLEMFHPRNFIDNWSWMNNGASIMDTAKF